MAGAVHGIQNSGDTLDGTNAAQCLMANGAPCVCSRQPGRTPCAEIFPTINPAVAAAGDG